MNIKNCVPIILINEADVTNNKLGRGDSYEVFVYIHEAPTYMHTHTNIRACTNMHTKKDNKLISYFPLGEADKTLKENLKKKYPTTSCYIINGRKLK